MTELPNFSRQLLESAKFFLQLATEESGRERRQAYLRATLYHALAYVEAQVNDIAEHFGEDGPFALHELAVLLERGVFLEHGQFVMNQSLRMTSLTDRIDVLAANFGEGPTAVPSYASFKSSIRRRNTLSHPKIDVQLSEAEVREAIESSVSVCNWLAKAIFSKPLPYADRGLRPTADYW